MKINQSQQIYHDYSLQNLSTPSSPSRLSTTAVNTNHLWANDAENHVSLMICFFFKLGTCLIIIYLSILKIY
jgi:hypothetical protein